MNAGIDMAEKRNILADQVVESAKASPHQTFDAKSSEQTGKQLKRLQDSLEMF